MNRTLKLRRRAAISLPEGSTEMAVAGKAQIHSQCGEVIILAKQVQRACQPQTQLVAIQWHGLYLLEHLCEVDGRDTDLRGDFSQGPAACQIRGQHELGAV